MKKRGLSALMLAAIAALSLTACGGKQRRIPQLGEPLQRLLLQQQARQPKEENPRRLPSTDPQVTLVYAESKSIRHNCR